MTRLTVSFRKFSVHPQPLGLNGQIIVPERNICHSGGKIIIPGSQKAAPLGNVIVHDNEDIPDGFHVDGKGFLVPKPVSIYFNRNFGSSFPRLSPQAKSGLMPARDSLTSVPQNTNDHLCSTRTVVDQLQAETQEGPLWDMTSRMRLQERVSEDFDDLRRKHGFSSWAAAVQQAKKDKEIKRATGETFRREDYVHDISAVTRAVILVWHP